MCDHGRPERSLAAGAAPAVDCLTLDTGQRHLPGLGFGLGLGLGFGFGFGFGLGLEFGIGFGFECGLGLGLEFGFGLRVRVRVRVRVRDSTSQPSTAAARLGWSSSVWPSRACSVARTCQPCCGLG